MKQSKEEMIKDLTELQETIDNLDPTSTDPDDQIALKIFTTLKRHRIKCLDQLNE